MSTTNKNPWDKLDFTPNSHDAADNVELAQPVLLEILAKIGDPQGLRILDFGCGTGQFAQRLYESGYVVEGIDTSANMIAYATKHYGTNIYFRVGNAQSLPFTPIYDGIVSCMVLQFIEDTEQVLKRFAISLNTKGYLVLAVHNPAFVKACITADKRHFNYEYNPLFPRGLCHGVLLAEGSLRGTVGSSQMQLY